jgi:hypothetical protein
MVKGGVISMRSPRESALEELESLRTLRPVLATHQTDVALKTALIILWTDVALMALNPASGNDVNTTIVRHGKSIRIRSVAKNMGGWCVTVDLALSIPTILMIVARSVTTSMSRNSEKNLSGGSRRTPIRNWIT